MLKSKIVVGLISACLVGFVGVSYANTTHKHHKGTETTQQYMKGSAITAKVKAKLLTDSDISSLHISVKTHKRIVTLTGYVDNEDQKQKAESLAHEVEGVKAVKNHLKIHNPAS